MMGRLKSLCEQCAEHHRRFNFVGNAEMPRMLSCPHGHRWEAADDTVGRADSLACPTCGSIVAMAEADVSTETAPTVLQAGSVWPVLSLNPSQPPPEIPEFEILEQIGQGGMGIVYRARVRADGHIVAIKVIRKDRLQHEEAVRRFRREAQAAARLDHPNIVRVCDFDRAGDTHYLVMEYVDGITLERYVEQQGSLAVAQACDFIRQAALGLQHAHEQALVHRDIKPSNLMVTPAPRGDQAAHPLCIKLLDMGVARVLQIGGGSANESLSTLTQGGAVIGTADYVAPEQLEDPHGADIRADLYSLGCTFYFLLTGRVPFPGGSLISKLDKQRWHEPTPIETLRGDIPPAVARVVAKLMEKKPADRFKTPGEIAEALATLAQNGFEEPPSPRVEIREVRRLLGHADAIGCVRYSPSGKHLVSGSKDGALLLWDASSGQLALKFAKHPQEVRSVAFAPSGEQLASASGFTVRLFDVRGQELRRFSGHTAAIKCLAFSTDGKRLATGSDDKTVRLWDVSTGRETQRYSRHTQGITALAFLPGGQHLASASRDQTIRLWDLRSGLETDLLDAQAGHVLDLASSPDGKRLASAHFDTIVRIWNLESSHVVGQCAGHKQMVSGLTFTLDGRRLLTASQDQSLRLWSLDAYAELADVARHSAGINALSLSPDGVHVATAGADKRIVISALP